MTRDENSSLLSQRKPKRSGYNGMFSVFAFWKIMISFNQTPMSRCDPAMPSRAIVILKGPNKDEHRVDCEIFSQISEAKRGDL